MDYKNISAGRRPLYLAATATALGTGYYYYRFRIKSETVIKAVVVLQPEGDSKITGSITFEQSAPGGPVTKLGNLKGLPPNAKRGFHVHQWGDLTDGCTSAGPHPILMANLRLSLGDFI